MNGSIEVVMHKRDASGNKLNEKTRFAATASPEGAEWLAGRALVTAGKHIHPARFNDFADEFFGEGYYAPQPD